jgi:hypothetical protein
MDVTARIGLSLVLLALPCAARAELPDGWFVWMSNRKDGRHEIYRRSVAGTEPPTRLTVKGAQIPLISPDGRWIAYRFPGDGSVHIVSSDGKVDRELCRGLPVEASPGFWLHDGGGYVCALYTTSPELDVEYRLVHPDTGASQTLFRQTEFAHLGAVRFDPGGLTADRRWLVGWGHNLFQNGHTATNGTFKFDSASVALDLQHKDAVYFIGRGCFATTAPSGRWIYHAGRHDPATKPDIYRLGLDQLMDRSSYAAEVALPDAQWGHENMPRISTDGRWLIYAATTGCHNWLDCNYDVFAHRLGSGPGERHRLTDDPRNDSFPHMFVPTAAGADAAPPRDAGLDARADAADAPAASSGCAMGAGPPPEGWLVLLLLGVGWARRGWCLVAASGTSVLRRRP